MRRVHAIAGAVVLVGAVCAPAEDVPRLGRFLWQVTAPLRDPVDVAFMPDGRIAVLDRGPAEVVIFDANGAVVETIQPGAARPDALAVLSNESVAVAQGGQIGSFAMNSARGGVVDVPGRIIALDSRGERFGVAFAEGDSVALIPHGGGAPEWFGSWGASKGQCISPAGIALTDDGRVIISDSGNDRIVVFGPGADDTYTWGGFGSFPGRLARPQGIAWRGGAVYTADSQNHRINVYLDDGSFLYDWGTHVLRPREGEGRLHYPSRIAVRADGELAVVLEPIERRIQVFGVVEAEAPPADERDLLDGSAALHFGSAIAVAGELMATTEPDTGQVVISTIARGTPIELTRIGRRGPDIGLFRDPTDVAIDLDRRRVIVADAMSRRVSIFELDWNPGDPPGFDPFMARLVRSYDLVAMKRERWGGEGPADVRAVGVFGDGSLIIADAHGGYRVDMNGELVRTWGDRGGPGFGEVVDICVAGSRLYVLDAGGAGSNPPSVYGYSVSGGALELEVSLELQRPAGVAVVGEDLVISDEGSDSLAVVSQDGASASLGGPGLGRVQFSHPAGIAALPDGRFVVVDRGNHRLQFLGPDGTFSSAFGSRVYVLPTEVEGETR